MLKPKKMRKVRLIVLKAEVEKLIKDLHINGIVQISKTKFDGLEDGRPLPAFDELSRYLVKLRGMLSIMEQVLGKQTYELKFVEPKDAIEEAKKMDIEPKIISLTKKIEEDSSLLKDLQSKNDFVKKLLVFGDIDFSKLKSRTLDYRIGKCQNVLALKEKAGKIDDTTILTKPGAENILVVFRTKYQNTVDAILSECGFTSLELDSSITTPAATVGKIALDIETAVKRITDSKNLLKSMAQGNIQKVNLLINSFEIGAQRAEIANKFASSKSLYIIQGWVVEENYDKLAKIIQNYHSSAMIENMTIGHDESPPIVFNNPGIASPFEFLTKNYSLPTYFELDPTMAYFIALPIIYGMIVGDVLYGLISILLAMWFMKKFAKSEIMRNVSKIWLYSAFPTMFFGVIFDEWGGMSHFKLAQTITSWTGIQLLSGPLYDFHLQRMENILTLVGITVIVGLIHLAIGFLFGAINEWNHNRKHAIGKLAWIGLEIGAVLALAGALMPNTPFAVPGLVIVGVSIIVIGWGEGMIGIIEIPGFVGNALSYTRIAAIGVVGVVIANLLNNFILPVPSQGWLVILLIPIYIGLHILNCFIAMFESLIQGGRLNIVEFRSKFLHGGDSLFTPFVMRGEK